MKRNTPPHTHKAMQVPTPIMNVTRGGAKRRPTLWLTECPGPLSHPSSKFSLRLETDVLNRSDSCSWKWCQVSFSLGWKTTYPSTHPSADRSVELNFAFPVMSGPRAPRMKLLKEIITGVKQALIHQMLFLPGAGCEKVPLAPGQSFWISRCR